MLKMAEREHTGLYLLERDTSMVNRTPLVCTWLCWASSNDVLVASTRSREIHDLQHKAVNLPCRLPLAVVSRVVQVDCTKTWLISPCWSLIEIRWFNGQAL